LRRVSEVLPQSQSFARGNTTVSDLPSCNSGSIGENMNEG
jgi:hypothetical protein